NDFSCCGAEDIFGVDGSALRFPCCIFLKELLIIDFLFHRFVSDYSIIGFILIDAPKEVSQYESYDESDSYGNEHSYETAVDSVLRMDECRDFEDAQRTRAV